MSLQDFHENKTDNDDNDDNVKSEIWLDVMKLKLMGILWCDGDPHERITELYHVFQDNHQEKIAWSDKDMPIALTILFNFATKVIFNHIKKYPELCN